MPNLGEFTEEIVLRTAKEQYEQGEARVALHVESVALLVVDMLDEFVKPQWSPYWVPDATRQASLIRRLQDDCRSMKVPVINIGYDTTLMGLDSPAPMRTVPIGAGEYEFIGQLFMQVSFYEEVASARGRSRGTQAHVQCIPRHIVGDHPSKSRCGHGHHRGDDDQLLLWGNGARSVLARVQHYLRL